MSYVPELTDEAFEDLERLLDSLADDLREPIITAVEALLGGYAADPSTLPRSVGPHPFAPLDFQADGLSFRWGMTYVFSQDEKRIQVTHIFRAGPLF